MEAASVAAPAASRVWERVRAFLGQWGLIIVLLAMPVYYGIQDISNDGNLTRLGNNLVAGLSNGSHLALVALRHTPVYRVLQVINLPPRGPLIIGAGAP